MTEPTKCPKCGEDPIREGGYEKWVCECGYSWRQEMSDLRRQLAAANERAEKAEASKGHVLMTPDDCTYKGNGDSDYHEQRCPVCACGLSVCKVCHGGESELDEPCIDRVVRQRNEAKAKLSTVRAERDRLREFMHRVCDAQRQRKAPTPTPGGNPIYYFDTDAIQDAFAWLNDAAAGDGNESDGGNQYAWHSDDIEAAKEDKP